MWYQYEEGMYFLYYAKWILRGGAEVARQAHNLKVRGSNPLPATRKRRRTQYTESSFFFALFKKGSILRLLQKSTVSQSRLQDCLDFAERMKRKALRVRSEGSIPQYVTEAESRKQHSGSPLCNSLILYLQYSSFNLMYGKQ